MCTFRLIDTSLSGSDTVSSQSRRSSSASLAFGLEVADAEAHRALACSKTKAAKRVPHPLGGAFCHAFEASSFCPGLLTFEDETFGMPY